MLQALGLFLILQLDPLYCKLILSTNSSKPVQNEKSHAEILNTSLQSFDNFTLCARYGIASQLAESSRSLWENKPSLRFLTFNFSSSIQLTDPNQYLFNYQQMPLLGIYHPTNLLSQLKTKRLKV